MRASVSSEKCRIPEDVTCKKSHVPIFGCLLCLLCRFWVILASGCGRTACCTVYFILTAQRWITTVHLSPADWLHILHQALSALLCRTCTITLKCFGVNVWIDCFVYNNKCAFLDAPVSYKSYQATVRITLVLSILGRCGTFSESIQEVHLFLSARGGKTIIHKDPYSNIHCVFNGTKDWILIDPSQTDLVYMSEESQNEWGGFSDVDVDAVDLVKFPGISGVRYSKVTLNKGDCIFMPGGESEVVLLLSCPGFQGFPAAS